MRHQIRPWVRPAAFDAILYTLVVIGEAVNALPPERLAMSSSSAEGEE
jgi:hypothetical protein